MTPALKPFAFDGLLYLTNRIVAHVPSKRLRNFFYRRVLKFDIGPGTYIFMGAWFDSRGRFPIGSNSIVNQKCRLDNRGGITIGNNVSISAEVALLTGDHDIQSSTFAGRERPIVIGDYVFLGTRCMLLPGVTVGTGAVVGAGSIVTHDIEPYAIVAGNPAKAIGVRNRDLRYSAHYPRVLH